MTSQQANLAPKGNDCHIGSCVSLGGPSVVEQLQTQKVALEQDLLWRISAASLLHTCIILSFCGYCVERENNSLPECLGCLSLSNMHLPWSCCSAIRRTKPIQYITNQLTEHTES